MKNLITALIVSLSATVQANADTHCSAAAAAYNQARSTVKPGPDTCEATLKQAISLMKKSRNAADDCGCAELTDQLDTFLTRLRNGKSSCFDKSQGIMLYDAQFADLISACR